MQNKAKITPVLHCSASLGSTTWPVTIRNDKTDFIHLFLFLQKTVRYFWGSSKHDRRLIKSKSIRKSL